MVLVNAVVFWNAVLEAYDIVAKKNNKSDLVGFPFVLKQINLSVNHGEKSKSRNFGRDSEVLQTINYEDLKSLQDIRKRC